jgi:hypothetical protein
MVVGRQQALDLLSRTQYTPEAESGPAAAAGAGSSAGTSRQTSQDCRRNGRGWVDLADTDPAHGNRATGVTACLDAAYLETHTGRPTGSIKPPGYYWARDYADSVGLDESFAINNCHLLGSQLTGDGRDLRNLATCSRQANAAVRGDGRLAGHMVTIENRVRAAIRANQVVLYEVVPQYAGDRTVPVAFDITAVGWSPGGAPGIQINEVVPNFIYSQQDGWRNLGLMAENGRPVPVGVTP